MNRILKKFLSFSIGSWVSILIGLLFTPVLTRNVSPEVLGKHSFYITLLNFIVFGSIFGLDQGYIRFYSESDENEKSSLFYSLLKLTLYIASFLSILILIYRKKISYMVLGNSNENISSYLIIALLSQIFNRFILVDARMAQKGKVYSALQIISKVLDCSTVIILILFKKASALNLIKAISLVYFLIFLFGLFTKLNTKEKRSLKINRINNSEVIKYSFPLFFSAIVTLVFQFSDRFMLRKLSSFNEIGIYTGGMKIIGLFLLVQSSFNTYWTPLMYEKYNENKKERIFFKEANEYYSFVIMLIVILGISLRSIIIFFLGPQYREAVLLIPTLMLIFVFGVSETTYMGMVFEKKSKVILYLSCAVAIINILGNFIMIPYLGAKGASISTGFSYLCFMLLRTYFGQKYFNFCLNYKKMFISLFVLVSYILYTTFYNFPLIDLIMGMVGMVIILIMNHKNIKKIMEHLGIKIYSSQV